MGALILIFIFKPHNNRKRYFRRYEALFCIIHSKMKEQTHMVFNTTRSYIHFRIFLEFLQTKIQNFSSHFEQLLFFKTFQVLENGIVNFHNSYGSGLYYCHCQYSKENKLSENIKYWNNKEAAKDNSRGRNRNRSINGNNFVMVEKLDTQGS